MSSFTQHGDRFRLKLLMNIALLCGAAVDVDCRVNRREMNKNKLFMMRQMPLCSKKVLKLLHVVNN